MRRVVTTANAKARSTSMLAALAAAALVISTVGATVSVSQEPQQMSEETRPAIVAVRISEPASPSDE
jgi:hypothetical protein